MEELELLKISKKLRKKFSSLHVASTESESKDYISTGNLAVDLGLEGGIAFGYVSEFQGKSGSGKTLMMQLMLADAQKKYNAIGIWFDREKAWSNDRAVELGIDLDRVIVVDPVDIATVPDMEILAKELLKSIPKEEYRFMAVDSISAFAQEGEKADMGKKAQSLHKFFRTVIPEMNSKTSFNFANQITYKIGILFGDPTTTTGGEAPKYYSTYRLKLDDKKPIIDKKRGNEIIGNWIETYIVKTRMGPNHRSVKFPFYYKEGIPYYGGYARLLANRGYLQPNNVKEFNSFKQSTLNYTPNEDIEIPVNEHNIEKFLDENPQLLFNEYPEYWMGE